MSFVREVTPVPEWIETVPLEKIPASQMAVLANGVELDWFTWRYQISKEEVLFEQVGYDNRLRSFSIPVWDADHQSVLAVRYRRFDQAFPDEAFKIGSWNVPRYFGLKGKNPILLYNRWRLKRPRMDTVRIAFGELTSLFIDRTLERDALSVTNGAKAFKPYFANLVRRVYPKVIIVPDGGEWLQAVKVGRMFGPIAQIVRPVSDVGDLIDWCREGMLNRNDYLDYERANLASFDGFFRSADTGALWQT